VEALFRAIFPLPQGSVAVSFRPNRWFAIAVFLPAVGVAAPASAGVPLANYRSVHDLNLAGGAELAEIGSMKARLVTEFTGSRCAGYTTKMRFVTRSTGDEGAARTDDVRSVMFETADGFYEFTHETYSEDGLVDVSAGTAERGEAGVTVRLTEPEEKSFDLDAETAFPTEQVVRVLAAAVAGKRFVAFDLYDGTEGGESVYGTSTVIGAATTAADDLGVETSVADAGFAAQRHWPVTISYFPQSAGTAMTPDYTMSLIVYENGVSRDLKLDYGTFALAGKLTQLEMLPVPPCAE
jgi:hypothetical protein